MDAVVQTRAGPCVRVRVKPGARVASVTLDGDVVRVAVNAVAEKGKANAAVIKALGAALGVPPSALEVRTGAGARDKLVAVKGLDAGALRTRVAKLRA